MINIINVDSRYERVDFTCPHCGQSYRVEWWDEESDYYEELECYKCDTPLILDIEVIKKVNYNIHV